MIGLEFIRKMYNDTTTTLAEKLGITNAVISQWENQKKTIPDNRLDELSQIYGVPKHYFAKELTRLEQLKVEKSKMQREYKNIPVSEYNSSIDEHFRIIDSEMLEEKLIQEIRDVIGSSYSDVPIYEENINGMIDKRAMDIKLLHKFVSLMKKNTFLFLAYVLKAVEISDLNYSGEQAENSLANDTLVKQLFEVLREYRLKKKEEAEQARLEFEELFGNDDYNSSK